MYDFSKWLSTPRSEINSFQVDKNAVQKIFENVRNQGRKNLLEEEGYGVIEAYGFPRPKSFVASNVEECVKAANEMGYPVVMKIVSEDIIHKSDAGGVRVGLQTSEEVSTAFKEIMDKVKQYKPNAKIKGILVQQMIISARETILGSKNDPIFGPLIMFGLGGIYVEVLKDVIFRLAPINEREAINMINSIRTSKLLHGVRGQKPSDINSLVDCLLRLSQLVTDFPEIMEFDMNPLLVLDEGKGACAVDVRIGLK
jgi:4-hydroxybutyryl-CoA synthetase (ADP-forming)